MIGTRIRTHQDLAIRFTWFARLNLQGLINYKMHSLSCCWVPLSPDTKWRICWAKLFCIWGRQGLLVSAQLVQLRETWSNWKLANNSYKFFDKVGRWVRRGPMHLKTCAPHFSYTVGHEPVYTDCSYILFSVLTQYVSIKPFDDSCCLHSASHLMLHECAGLSCSHLWSVVRSI